MLLASICILGFVASAPTEPVLPYGATIAVCDIDRKVSWDVQGRQLNQDALPNWARHQLGLTSQALSKVFTRTLSAARTDSSARMIVVSVPAIRREDFSQVFVRLPNSARKSSDVGLPSPDGKTYLSLFALSAKDTAGPFEIGIANDPWKVTGTRWYPSQKTRGEKFSAVPEAPFFITQFGRTKPDRSFRYLTVKDFTTTPKNQAWKVIAYDAQGNPMRSAGSSKFDNNPLQLAFIAVNKRDPIRRADLMRRPIKWVKLGSLPLAGPSSKGNATAAFGL